MYKNLEEYSLNAWPALQSFVYDGWLLRFAAGYTKRSNSINPIYKGESKKVLDKIKYCESIYSSMKGLDAHAYLLQAIPDYIAHQPSDIIRILNNHFV